MKVIPKTISSGSSASRSEELIDLYCRIAPQRDPAAEDVQHFADLALDTPAMWDFATQTTEGIRRALIDGMSDGQSRPLLVAEEKILKEQFGYATAPPMERLAIDQILTTRIRLVYVELLYNRYVLRGLELGAVADDWDRLLSAAQRRFERAIELLAKIRRLATVQPRVNINIAQNGGQQLNL